MIGVIDIGLGNVSSVSSALTHLSVPHIVTQSQLLLNGVDKLIFPGVGNFSEASKRLALTGLGDFIKQEVQQKSKPILGICLGMQLLSERGFEGGESAGLGLIPGMVKRMACEKEGYRLPHVGWNDVACHGLRLFSGIEDNSCFYFVHSYQMITSGPEVLIAETNYGGSVVAAVKKGHILGVQFHPEKSQRAGLKLLKNFTDGII